MIIYKLTSPSNHSYIGQTKRSLTKRWKEHQQRPCETTLWFALQKYSADQWQVEIIERCTNAKELDEREVFWIDHFNTYHDGYNMTKGGNGWIKDTLSEQHKQRISKALKGKPKTLQAIENNRQSQLGKKRSRLSVEKQIAARKLNGVKQHIWTDEEKSKLSVKLKQRPKYNQKKIQTPLGIFDSCLDAANAYQKSASWVTRMVNKGKFILLVS